MKKLYTLIFVFAIASLQASAQRPQNEFQIFGGGGIPISLQSGVSTTGFSGETGIGFTAFVSRSIGIHFGVGVGTLHKEVNVDALRTVTYGSIDANGYVRDLHTTLFDYRETLRTSTHLSVPLMLQFQPNRHGFYAMGGVRMIFLASRNASYDVSVAALHNEAFYHQPGNWAIADIGTFPGNSVSRNFEFPQPTTMLTLEMGWKWRIGENVFLYTGAFLDYGLNDLARDIRQPLSNFTLPETLQNLTVLQYTDRVSPTVVGIKLRLAFAHSDGQRQRGGHGMRGHCPPPTRGSGNQNVIFNMPR
ncbi:MAG: hypothetical protein FWD02_00625 [Bacteroidales bacterium]|nr:hypothetical protein [Bacteroidales bacterium]